MWLKVRFSIDPGRRPGAAACLVFWLLVALLLCLAGGQETAVAKSQLSPTVSQALASSSYSLRQYYLTIGAHNGAQADDSCALGYHMASLWDFIDTSNLRYNVANGYARGDSRQGPPTTIEGWVRTGYSNSVASTPGQANCNGWASDGVSDYGSSVYLPGDWTAGGDLGIWKVGAWGCDFTLPVWCVADDLDAVGSCTAPLALACGQQVAGNTTGLASHHDSYDCAAWDESGPEIIYSVSLPAASAPYTITATLSDLAVGLDLDVFLLPAGGCRGKQCAAYGNVSATASGLAAGTYYVVVDGFDGAAGSFTLDLTCSPQPDRQVYLPLILRGSP